MLTRSAFVLTLLACVTVLTADDDLTRLRIRVTTLQDKPIDRASVVVQFVEGRSIAKLGKKMMTRWELKTNQEGIAKIPTIPQGKVRVQVIAKGYQTFGEVFDVNEEEKLIAVKLNPPQPQYSAH
jgi:hypothetical protein